MAAQVNSESLAQLTNFNLERLADLVQEAGMLSKTPRTGWPFLRAHSESVSEHLYRTTVIGFILARLAQADAFKVVSLCLFHDLHEARTGDFNYVYHRYNTTKAREAVADATSGSGLHEEILALFDTFQAKDSLEALLAHDADQLDLIANLTVALQDGHEFAREWLDAALPRLCTREGKILAEAILRRDVKAWWYEQKPKEWWIHHQ